MKKSNVIKLKTKQKDIFIKLLLQYEIPVTRENYIKWAYPYHFPEEWTAVLESMLPEHLQDWGKVK